MTTFTKAKIAIAQQWVDKWVLEGSTNPKTAFLFENENFDTENDGDFEWARVSIRHNRRQQESHGRPGNRRYESGGSVFIQIFVPQGEGTSRADELAEFARNIFEGVTLAGTDVRFFDVTIREGGPDGTRWYAVTVDGVFEYTEIR